MYAEWASESSGVRDALAISTVQSHIKAFCSETQQFLTDADTGKTCKGNGKTKQNFSSNVKEASYGYNFLVLNLYI